MGFRTTYFLFRISKRKPAARPLRASSIRGHCPMSIVPAAWPRVIALSNVLNTQAIRATRSTRSSLAGIFFLDISSGRSAVRSGAVSSDASASLWMRRVRMIKTLSTARKTESTAASAISIFTKLLFAYCSRMPAA